MIAPGSYVASVMPVFDFSNGEEIPPSEITWSTETPNLINLNPDGSYEVLDSEGTAYITASWNGYTSRCRIEIVPFRDTISANMVTEATGPGRTSYISLYENSLSRFGDGYTISWSVDDPSVVKLEPDSSGLSATAYSLTFGNALITAAVTWPDGSVRQCYINITVVYDE